MVNSFGMSILHAVRFQSQGSVHQTGGSLSRHGLSSPGGGGCVPQGPSKQGRVGSQLPGSGLEPPEPPAL